MFAAGFRPWFLATPFRSLIVVAAICCSIGITASNAADATSSNPVDPRLKALVERHLRSRPGYLSGDLLSRSDVEPVFNELLELGVQPSREGESLYRDYLRNDAPLVQLLESPEGRKFMRKVNQIPDAYDRLERLSWSPVGLSWLKQLIEADNGDKLFSEMLTEDGMKKVAETLKDDPSGRNFGLPTGHVYTEAELLGRLHRAIASQPPKSNEATQK